MRRPSPRPPLTRLAFALLVPVLGAACKSASRGPAEAHTDADRIRSDIAYLADDRLEGRGTGTAGNDSAAAWLARRHAALGLRPVTTGYLQQFIANGAELAHAGKPEGVPTQNVVAMVPGSDPALRGQYVVLGAHFDHLGRSIDGALDPEAGHAIRNGADDNASGTAAILELARRLVAHPTKRSILVVHFSGEELGLLGSQWFVEHSPVPVDSMDAMLNFDMVGRLRKDRLIVYGLGTATEIPALVDSANVAPRLDLVKQDDGFGPSDHSSFYAKGIPVLHFFTDLHEDYHRATDDIEKINAPGEVRVVDLAERIVREIADRPARLTPVRTAPKQVMSSQREGSNVYLGTIPDMAASGTPGLKLTGVRAGSPADKGGLKAGDVIVLFGGREVRDLYTYSDALYAHHPGEEVEVVYVRGGTQHSTTVTLGIRPR
jgi:aminopeptidase YwaD